ncbi:MAG: META domain-containing protein [Methanocorpusculum sp.]|nr:META domain-containing protein [Methanocorpusculum sp.]
MKKLIIVVFSFLIICGIVFAAGCITPGAPDSGLNGNYILTSFDNQSIYYSGIISLAINGTSLSGNSGVNDYTAVAVFPGLENITIGSITSTKMTGHEIMTEKTYLTALANASSFKRVNGTLTFMNAAGVPLLSFVEVSGNPVGEWVLSSDSKVTLSVNSDGNFSGRAPVNSYSGIYTFTQTGLAFPSGFISTQTAGTDAQNLAEREFYAALNNVSGSTVTDGRLTLLDANGQPLLIFNKNPQSILGTWVLVTDKNVTFTITDDGNFGGRAPVNIYTGTYHFTETGFGITGYFSTLLGGTDAQDRAEREFYAALINVSGSTVTDGRLILLDANGQTLLVFNKTLYGGKDDSF